jgi:hypothetical protein
MRLLSIRRIAIAFLGISITACSAAKLEARFEANPQCKEVVNPKTGAVMPCPGSDKAFYKSVGLEPAKIHQTDSTLTPISPTKAASDQQSSVPVVEATSKPVPPPSQVNECKPTLHKKTGGILPCPSTN